MLGVMQRAVSLYFKGTGTRFMGGLMWLLANSSSAIAPILIPVAAKSKKTTLNLSSAAASSY